MSTAQSISYGFISRRGGFLCACFVCCACVILHLEKLHMALVEAVKYMAIDGKSMSGGVFECARLHALCAKAASLCAVLDLHAAPRLTVS